MNKLVSLLVCLPLLAAWGCGDESEEKPRILDERTRKLMGTWILDGDAYGVVADTILEHDRDNAEDALHIFRAVEFRDDGTVTILRAALVEMPQDGTWKLVATNDSVPQIEITTPEYNFQVSIEFVQDDYLHIIKTSLPYEYPFARAIDPGSEQVKPLVGEWVLDVDAQAEALREKHGDKAREVAEKLDMQFHLRSDGIYFMGSQVAGDLESGDWRLCKTADGALMITTVSLQQQMTTTKATFPAPDRLSLTRDSWDWDVKLKRPE